MDTTRYIQLPDGSYAAVLRSMTWGEVVIILLLVAIVFLQVVSVWMWHWQRMQHPS